MLLVSPRNNIEGDCGVTVYRECASIDQRWKSDIVRANCPGISREGIMIPEECLQVGAYLGVGSVRIIDQNRTVLASWGDRQPEFTICLYQGHYWHVKSLDYFSKKCPTCGIASKDFRRHRCNTSSLRYRLLQGLTSRSKLRDRLIPFKPKDREIGRRYIVFDLETHPIAHISPVHIPYAVGFMEFTESQLESMSADMIASEIPCEVLWGETTCIRQFIDLVETRTRDSNEELVLISFNGSGFDHYFLLREFIERESAPETEFPRFILNNGNIKDMRTRCREPLKKKIRKKKHGTRRPRLDLARSSVFFETEVEDEGGDEVDDEIRNAEEEDQPSERVPGRMRTCDVFQFVPGSLAECGKAFGCAVQKGSFPHLFMCDPEYVGPEPDWSYYPSGAARESARAVQTQTGYHPESSWSFRDVCTGYLMCDVRLTTQIFSKLRAVLKEFTGENMEDFITISQMSFKCWQQELCPTWTIQLPQNEEYEFLRRAMYGGRCYNTVTVYDPPRDRGETLSMLDAVSLYPTSMLSEEFPSSMSRPASDNELRLANSSLKEAHDAFWIGEHRPVRVPIDWKPFIPIGVFLTRTRPNKRLLDPPIPRRDAQTGRLVWDLVDSEDQVYCTTDIVTAVTRGYHIELVSGLVWDFSDAVFAPYINRMFGLKQRGEDEKNAPLRQAGKLMMNALYGKMLQRRQDQTVSVVTDETSMSRFLDENDWNFFRTVAPGKALVGGTKREAERENTKPTQLGVFVLAHSRRIWNAVADIVDPTRYFREPKNFIKYTDTDSWIVPTGSIERLRSVGVFGEGKLGLVSDDLKGGRITKAVFVGPKAYALTYEMPGDKTASTFSVKTRFKGVPAHAVTESDFEVLAKDPSARLQKCFDSLKKYKLDAPDDREPFTIESVARVRTMACTCPTGRIFSEDGSSSVPLGFE